MPEATTEIAVREPADRSTAVKSGQRRHRNIDRAARELNMLSVSSLNFQNFADVGEFVRQIGLVKYGSGRLLGSAQMIAESAVACAALSKKEGLDDESRRGYLELQLRFLKALDQNVALQLEINKASEADREKKSAGGQAKPFLPGATVSPIQINISPSGATITETKEIPCKASST